MRYVNPFRYMFLQPAKTTSAILKLHFGKKYFIIKAKSPQSTANSIAHELDRRLRLGADEDNIYYNIVTYIRKARVGMFEVEVLFESEKELALLKREYAELKVAKGDDNCLNKDFEAYIPKWISEKTVKQFEAWKTSLTTKKPVKKNATDKPAKNNKDLPSGRGGGKKGTVQDTKRRVAGTGRAKKSVGTV